MGRWGDGEIPKSRARAKRQELIKYSAASLLPVPVIRCSLFPVPCSLFPVPYSL
ncbi:MAG: hypothetical protein F6J98_08440 [Moorea sp. SIO4G2]|uniref:hypothetical protein n=1 Tax=Moorena TaxID=1155738 RepID=UPI00130147FE|nr:MULTISPECIES: hypothetical protein [Moorena]NEO43697.1 hypothetical protein [Moorena sp. SIO4A3]NEO60454.1 hypothetical protein [Moorena sp. SIO4G2]NEO14333.1 hypothetical protein [Moorena sp. SIO3E8]NEO24201.1 hypothetical protein [Moorena sp. SIO4A5]NEQ00377.1 hypothetical protein [Moorena sp. SIO3F7]